MVPVQVESAEMAEKRAEPGDALESGGEKVIDMADEAEKDEKPTSTDEKEKKESGGGGFAAYRKLFSYATPLDVSLRIIGGFAACGAGVALPLMTLIFGRLVNDFNGWAAGTVSPAELRAAVNRNSLYFVYLFIAKFSLVYIHTSCFTLTATRATRSIRLAYIKALLRQDIAYFDTCTPGAVATSISNNADMIQTGLSEKVGVAIQSLAMLTAAFVVAFTQGWKLTLVTATTLPAAVIAVGMTVALDARQETKILAIYATAAGLVEEALSSIRNVTAFGANDKFQKNYDVYLDQAKKFGVKKGPILGVQYSSEFFMMYCAYALAFWYGVQLLTKGQMKDGGQVVTVLFSVIIGTSSITMIAPAIGEFTKAAAAAQSVLELIAQEPNIDPIGTDGFLLDSIEGKIKVNKVTFAYPARPTMNVLNEVSMEFEAQKTTAIVGASGSGKSTIVALMERWYDPASGTLELDGTDIRTINVKSLRSQIGLVQQEPVLFNDTIYNNVVHGLYGTPMNDLPEDEKRRLVKEACTEANANSFIQELPEGYDTKVGERGGFISGGQKQRIAIARSIIKNPRILLLDEATSALDPTAEGLVQAALDKVSQTRTTIMIAHKLSTVKKADKIIVMNQGTVIEEGTHEGLLRADGAYARLVAAQNLGGHDGNGDETEDVSTNPDEETEFNLTNTKTFESTASVASVLKNENISRRFSLAKCLAIILYERRKLWYLFLGGLVAAVVGGGVFPAQAIVFSRAVLVFQYSGQKIVDEANFWALMFFVLALIILLSYAGIGFFMTVAAFLTTRVYRSEYFAAMLRQDISFFDIEGNSSGALTSRLSTDPARLQDTVSANLGLIVIVIVNLTSCCTLALVLGWKLALVAIFGCIPALFFAGFMRMRLEMTNQDRTAKMYQESARFAAEAVGAIRTVSALTLESKVLENYGNRLNSSVKKGYKHIAVSMFLFGLSDSLDLIAMALAFWYGGQLLSKREYDPQTFFTIFTAIIFGGQAAGFLFGFTMNTTKAHAAANQILYLREQKPPINSSTGVPPILDDDESDMAILFDNVRFAYPTRPDLPVLRGLNMKIRRGQSVGIVGASGCGKTTVIGLLERFYDIKSGDIRINGQSLQALDVHQHRAMMGLVSQDTTLYQGSIRDNVLLGIPDSQISSAEEEEAKLVAACRDANIHDFILSLPSGYATDSGSRGLALSGGQRQRIAVARALIRDPKILLLDEATSALDTQSEEVVQKAIERASEGRTTVAVAHRLSTVKGCDKIFVLEKGRVVEEGTHDELTKRRGRYFEMVQAQGLDVQIK